MAKNQIVATSESVVQYIEQLTDKKENILSKTIIDSVVSVKRKYP